MSGSIELKINVPDTTNVKWSDVHKNITDDIASGTDQNVFKGWIQLDIDKFKESVKTAATEYGKGGAFSTAIKAAVTTLTTDLTNAVDDAAKVLAYETYHAALKAANTTLFTGGRSKIGGSKRRGSKRRGSKKRRSSKSKSKGRK